MSKSFIGISKDNMVSQNTPFPVSAQLDNVILKSCEYVTGESSDWEAIKFTYTRGASVLTDTVFLPDYAKCEPWKGSDRTKDEEYTYRMKVMNTTLAHIATASGMSEDELYDCDTSSFKKFALDFCRVVNGHCKSNNLQKMWMKTSKNKNGYVVVSRSTSSARPFLQTMVDDEPCVLEYTANEITKLQKIKDAVPATPGVATTGEDDEDDWGI